MSNHPGKVILELDDETAAFLMDNCNTNMQFGLGALQTFQDRDAAVKMVNLIENFKKVRAALLEAGVKSE